MSDPVLQFVIKVVVSGIFVGLISEAAKRLPGVGGLIAALPIISLTSIFWLSVDGQTNSQISTFIRGILIGLFPTTLFLLVVKLLLDHEVHIAPAIGAGLVALAIAWFAVRTWMI